MKSIIQNRLAQVRSELNKKDINAIIVLTADPHLSEYLPEHWQQREWLSGFTGSAGTLVVTADYAGLWADSRYWIQGEEELVGTGIELQKWQKGNTYTNWLVNNLPKGARVEVNANMLSIADKDNLLKAFAKKNIQLITTDDDSATTIYNQGERPPLPTAKLYRHDPQFVSVTTSEKLAQVREGMTKVANGQGASHHLLSSLDDIAWLTNLRGADIDYNPVFLSHLLINQDHATLFVEQSKVDNPIKKELANAGITLADYEQVTEAIAKLTANDSLLIDPSKVAVATLATLHTDVTVIKEVAPSTFLKSIKSLADIDNIREAMRQDGVALCEFFAEFERRLQVGEPVSELDVDSMLIEYRSQQANYVSPSFPTIAGFKGNGAIVHYRATEDNYSKIEGDGLLLIDSGAQYHNGTTDITRVVPVGNITDEQKRDFTVVLKAHIALAMANFPEGIASPSIDAICRAPLWAMQMDFGHGTGHGVGYFMNVHEGPQRIAFSSQPTPETAMRAGMITSNEPGLYRSGDDGKNWGIRIESLVANMAVEKPVETDFGDYLYFETLTYCPIDTRLVNKQMLTETEINWLNDYHQKVFTELSNREMSDQGLAWLMEMTRAI